MLHIHTIKNNISPVVTRARQYQSKIMKILRIRLQCSLCDDCHHCFISWVIGVMIACHHNHHSSDNLRWSQQVVITSSVTATLSSAILCRFCPCRYVYVVLPLSWHAVVYTGAVVGCYVGLPLNEDQLRVNKFVEELRERAIAASDNAGDDIVCVITQPCRAFRRRQWEARQLCKGRRSCDPSKAYKCNTYWKQAERESALYNIGLSHDCANVWH